MLVVQLSDEPPHDPNQSSAPPVIDFNRRDQITHPINFSGFLEKNNFMHFEGFYAF